MNKSPEGILAIAQRMSPKAIPWVKYHYYITLQRLPIPKNLPVFNAIITKNQNHILMAQSLSLMYIHLIFHIKTDSRSIHSLLLKSSGIDYNGDYLWND